MSALSKARPGVRFLTAGAVALLGISVGSMLTNAAGSHGSSSFVPMTPCRLMDTRSTSQVGPRGAPIGPNELYSATVWGSNGNCVIPNTATAVSLNVTFVNPTSGGFVSVFPPDKPNPGTSNLNFVAGQAPAPNGVTSPLSFDGKIGFYNFAGTVNLIADVVGYYEQAGAAPGGIVAGNCYAILRWDLPECKKATLDTGNDPRGVAFDGTFIWVVNQDDDNVSRYNPTTGAMVTFATGDQPTGVAFDGSSIWITNLGDDDVSRMNPLTGARVDFPVQDAPLGITFDGTSVWVANSSLNSVSKVNPATGTATHHPTGLAPTSVLWTGSHIFVTNQTSGTVTKINAATGFTVSTYPTGAAPFGIAFDGSHLWITNQSDDTVSFMDPGTGASSTLATGDAPRGIAFDGTYMWIANFDGDSVTRYDVATGFRTDYPVGDGPTSVAFDGSNIWVTTRFDDSVWKFVP